MVASRWNRRAWIFRAAALLLLLTASMGAGAFAQGGGLITPGVGITEVRIGDTVATMEEALGRADLEGTDAAQKTLNYQYFKKQLFVLVKDGKVTTIMILSSAYRTQGGVGVGSSMSEVESALGSSYQRKEGNVGPELVFPSGLRILFMGDRAIGIEVRPAGSSGAAATSR